jgi:hypothetical protein
MSLAGASAVRPTDDEGFELLSRQRPAAIISSPMTIQAFV